MRKSIAVINLPTGEGEFVFFAEVNELEDLKDVLVYGENTKFFHGPFCKTWIKVKKLSSDISIIFCDNCGIRVAFASSITDAESLLNNFEVRGFAVRRF